MTQNVIHTSIRPINMKLAAYIDKPLLRRLPYAGGSFDLSGISVWYQTPGSVFCTAK
jgi:hypothetical protein